jgi:uncharacterized protein YkwD
MACATATSRAEKNAGRSDEPSLQPAQTLSPSGTPSALYHTRVPARVSADPFAAQLKAELDRQMKHLGHAALAEDARLDQVAYDVARLTAENSVPTSSVLTFLLRYYGVVEPEPNLIEIRGEPGAETSAVEDLGRQIAQIPTASMWRQVGLGVWRSGKMWSATIALQEDSLSMEPLPRALPSGGHTAISGRVDGPYHSPEILVTPPTGGVERLPLQVHGTLFKARLECNRGDGPYQVEVGAEDRRGPTVLANFPVYCGITPPASFQVASVAAASVSDPRAVEQQILDLMDRDRASHGLPKLEREPRLAKVAEAYSQEMAESGEIAHVSQRTGNAVDRVRAARISPMPTTIAENVGRDYSAEAIERAFMASPGHRDNILARTVTHVGVGVALGKREGNAIPIFVTQVFAGWGQ